MALPQYGCTPRCTKPKNAHPGPENDLKNQCLEYLRLKGLVAWRQNTGATSATYKGKKRWIKFSETGISDLLGVLPGGRFVAVETKIWPRKPTDEQGIFQRQIIANGGLGFCVYSLDELVEALEAIGK